MPVCRSEIERPLQSSLPVVTAHWGQQHIRTNCTEHCETLRTTNKWYEPHSQPPGHRWRISTADCSTLDTRDTRWAVQYPTPNIRRRRDSTALLLFASGECRQRRVLRPGNRRLSAHIRGRISKFLCSMKSCVQSFRRTSVVQSVEHVWTKRLQWTACMQPLQRAVVRACR